MAEQGEHQSEVESPSEADPADFNYESGVNLHDAIMAQQKEIEKEVVSANQDIISTRLDFSYLMYEYNDDPVYQVKVHSLTNQYQGFRRIRGDGNCFFRAFGFAYLERLQAFPVDCKRLRTNLEKCRDELVVRGYPLFTLEDFHDNFIEVVNKVENQCSAQELLELFNDQGQSDYLVVYLRLVVSAYLQKEASFFENFIEGKKSLKEFCSQEVEPMAKESDHIHITALTAALDVSISVVYMDRGGTELTIHHFNAESDLAKHKLSLLYRPGHYDILYA